MAANCIRLFPTVRLLSWQRLSYCQSSISHKSLYSLSVHTVEVPIPTLSRLYSVTTNTKEDMTQDDEHKPSENFMKKLFSWWNDNNYTAKKDEETKKRHVGKEEMRKREELLRKLQKMYYAKPPIYPDLTFYKELFETFIAYNDRLAVETIWRIMGEMGVEPDSELKAQVEPFLKKVQEENS